MLKCLFVLFATLSLSVAMWINYHKKQLVKEALWGIVLLWLTAALCMAIVLHLPVASPVDWIAAITAPIYKPVAAWIRGGDHS